MVLIVINLNHSHELRVSGGNHGDTRSSYHHRHEVDPDSIPHEHVVSLTGIVSWTPQAQRELERVRRTRAAHAS